MQKAMNFNDAATVSVKGSDYRIHFWYMSKDAINIMNNSDVNEKKRCFVILFVIYIKKMSGCNSIECNSVKKTYYQRDRDVILSRANDYYENDRKRTREQTRDEYRNLSEEKK